MLLQFNFKNYKSFRDDTTLDLTATESTKYNNHIVKIGNEKVLPVSAIFGANASGKSNVYSAFKYMCVYVFKSLDFGSTSRSSYNRKSKFIKPFPFLFDESSKDAESLFEVYFTAIEDGTVVVYNYGFTINKNGVCEEWLNNKTEMEEEFKLIFYRNNEELDLSGIPPKRRENIEIALSDKTLVVSLGAALNIEVLKTVSDWFVDNYCVSFGEPTENFILSRLMPNRFDTDENVRKKVVDYFSSFDPSIIRLDVEIINPNDEDPDIQVYAVHKMIDSDKTGVLPLGQESAGTLKMFALYPVLQDVLENGSVMFVDELNSRLHPLLVRTFVTTFLNPEINKKNAQLIFTSHDTWQLNSNLLRKDEIWFTEKNQNGISNLYSLADFSDENTVENHEEDYMLGKYGAIPTVKNFDM